MNDESEVRSPIPAADVDRARTVHDVGVLTRRGRSRHWTGTVTPDGGAPVGLAVDGTPDGPAAGQVTAVHRVLARWSAIRREAEPGLSALLRDCGLPEVDPWRAFAVSGLSVPAESYDPSGAVHVHVDLVHVDFDDEFWPAIDVVDGDVIEVLSGT